MRPEFPNVYILETKQNSNQYIRRCVWSQNIFTMSCVCLQRLSHSHVIPTACNQEVCSNYRDAACSEGLPTQPIIWRDCSCQGAVLEEMELSYAVKKSPSQLGLFFSSYSPFPYRITPVKAQGQSQLGGWWGVPKASSQLWQVTNPRKNLWGTEEEASCHSIPASSHHRFRPFQELLSAARHELQVTEHPGNTANSRISVIGTAPSSDMKTHRGIPAYFDLEEWLTMK